MRQRHRRLAGAASRQVDGLIKQLQRAGGGHNSRQQNGGFQQGNGQVDKLLDGGRTVDAGGLVDGVVDVLQAAR